MVFKPKRVIKLGRDCPDFKRCERDQYPYIPIVGRRDDSPFKGTPFETPREIDWDKTPFGLPAHPRETKQKPAIPPKVVVVDCACREGCADRIHYEIPTAVKTLKNFGDCVGIKFSKEDIELLKKGVAEIIED